MNPAMTHTLPSPTPATDHNGHQMIIEATTLHKTYRTGALTVQALRGVDFVVSRGEMVAIMGPSGCGKTTLLWFSRSNFWRVFSRSNFCNLPLPTRSTESRTPWARAGHPFRPCPQQHRDCTFDLV